MIGRVFVVVLVLTAVACTSSPRESRTTDGDGGPAVALAEGDHEWRTVDGIRVPYTVTGQGDVTVVLVHCWMCDRTFWKNQVSVLAQTYRIVALDLPGHGEAGDDRTTWSIEQYGVDVAGLIRQLDLDRVVLVGHSMGGPVALRAAALSAERVRGVVAVDTLHDAEVDFRAPEVAQTMQAMEADFAETCARFVGMMFPEPGVDEARAWVEKRGCDPTRESIAIALMRDFANIDMRAWFSEAGVPIRAINAAGPNETRAEVNRKYSDFEVVFMEDVGHYPHLTRPDDFNLLLLDAIAGLVEDESPGQGGAGDARSHVP